MSSFDYFKFQYHFENQYCFGIFGLNFFDEASVFTTVPEDKRPSPKTMRTSRARSLWTLWPGRKWTGPMQWPIPWDSPTVPAHSIAEHAVDLAGKQPALFSEKLLAGRLAGGDEV